MNRDLPQEPLPYSAILQPGHTLGMMGGGQLGRMFCHAAQSLGYKVVVLEPTEESPAGRVAEYEVVSAYDDMKGLDTLLSYTQAVTTEFENVPAASLKYLSSQIRISPSAAVVAVVQDRIAEKTFIASQGIPVAPYAEIRTIEDLEKADNTLFPAILKAARLGYDGKGQARVKSVAEAVEAFKSFGEVPCVLEAMLPLKKEVSVVMARGFDGKIALFPIGVNTHINGILSSSVVGVEEIDPTIEKAAQEAAIKIALGLNYFGVMCVEFFILEDNRLVANEIAPRPHNSGHYTMNACLSSQFEQQVRVLAGMPLGSTDLLAPTIMLNILGDSWFAHGGEQAIEPDWASVLALPGVNLHLYGKAEARKGRKMGHINIVNKDPQQLIYYARQVSDILHLNAKI
ncbi:5-(carboxyamino)imidazole ribonucleotide synthase [Pelistega sp. NLN82]|uniref:N5-carboxyaminoimidazole ribonucleotide synthase n=1 Tax=Pelistega ratti TaxID=2652177 RepID=A0A6L9Y325_9BURK|nr:5-(carboxyamino)imidazole ribonucleotide synthase [Pelistega ratti]NEN74741.1 5-(carboxyamino)imidazole ribonucleotide synthase [Pelistega ratti]